MTVSVTPLTPPVGSDINFGAVVENVDLENLNGMPFKFTAKRHVQQLTKVE